MKVFDAAGQFLRTVGTPGGRNWVGVYDPNGMLMPRGLAIDTNGRLWVAEDDNQPRRVSVWEAKTGKFVKEFVGGTIYGAVNGGMIDPKNPNRAISAGCWFGIDLNKEGYRPLSTLWRRLSRDECFGFNPIYANATPGTRFVECKGRRFIVCANEGTVKVGELRPTARGGRSRRSAASSTGTAATMPWPSPRATSSGVRTSGPPSSPRTSARTTCGPT